MPGLQLVVEGVGGVTWSPPYCLWLNGTQELFNETPVRRGYANVDPAHPDPLYQSRLMAAQQAHAGIWGHCP